MGTQIDIVCKRRSKEAQERAEKEGGAHGGQSEGPKTLRAGERKSFGAYCPDASQFSEAESREMQMLTSQVDTRDIFSNWHRGVGICRVMAEREIIRRGHDSLLFHHQNRLADAALMVLSK